MSEKYVTENESGLWNNDSKTEDWMDDFKSKIYISEPGWHWIGARENEGDNRPALQVTVRRMDDKQINQYCSEYTVLTKEQAKEKWSKKEPDKKKTESEDDLPF
jgi:hypothetical protein|tara:strand:- start:136 stop:447 length:312 start_codon:yes stop_codon:yes gene_type:complete